jgi:site-specific DNA-methyltransferase (adenine-specific)
VGEGEEEREGERMKPYYEEDGITIYCGDCREVLPHLPKVDCMITDPPYGVNGGSGTKGKARGKKSNYLSFEDTIENVVSEIIPRFTQALSVCKRAIITPGTLASNFYPQPDSFGVLWQPSTVAMQKWGRCDAQPIFYYGDDPRSGKTIQFCSYKNTEIPENNGHPCPKPYGIWATLVMRVSLEEETILDPFMGSGTTLVAAKQLGRKAIGIEIERSYCDIAIERLRQSVFQFPKPEPATETQSLFEVNV